VCARSSGEDVFQSRWRIVCATLRVVAMRDLRVSDDVSPAAWIAPRLSGEFGAVTRTVPGGYEAYVRLCHPVADRERRPVSWSQVAAATDAQAHRLMQWHALVGSRDPLNLAGSVWRGSNPQRGNLEPEALGALCALLGEQTAAAAECFFCLWDGYGWVDSGPTVVRSSSAGAGRREDARAPAFSPEELSRPRVDLPQRRYLLLAGALPAAAQIVWPPFRQSPNLFWPADRAWCVATELDFDSTLVAGTTELIDALLEAPALEAWPVQADDSLAADADQINRGS
jgi:hypothetical protein